MNVKLPLYKLVSTPPLLDGESQRGYLLRLAALNGYESINSLTAMAELEPNAARAAVIPIQQLSPLLNRNNGDLERLRTAFTNGVPTPTKPYLDLKSSKVCTLCVQAYGYHQQYWSLGHAIACPIHHCRPLTHCPTCGMKLTWSRRNLCVCRCEVDFLTHSTLGYTNRAVLALLHLIHTLCQKERADETRLAAEGFPVNPLLALNLESLLKLIKKLGGQQPRDGRYVPGLEGELVATADALSAWPNGFHQYLDRVACSDNETISALGLRAQNERLYGVLFKAGQRVTGCDFLFEAFCQWSGGRTQPARLHTSHLPVVGEQGPRYVGINKAAELIGVYVPTVRTLIKLGCVAAHPGSSGRGWLIDTREGLPRKDAAADSLVGREAARLLGLPESVLKELRRRRVFRVRTIPERSSSFSLSDLDAFRDRFATETLASACDTKTCTLDEVLRKKLKGPKIAARLIERVLSGKMPFALAGGEALKQMRLPRQAVEAWVAEQKAQRAYLTPYEASQLIGCDYQVIDDLVAREYLTFESMGICRTSIDAFRRCYTPLALLAREAGTQSVQISRYCRDHAIPLLWAERRVKGAPQPFIHQAQLIELEPFIGAPLLRSCWSSDGSEGRAA